jgi:uncharacterized membrane protein YbhN (UPF0104 family)
MSVAGWPTVARTLEHVDWRIIALAAGAVIFSHVGYVWAYREVASVAEGAEMGRLEAAALVTTGFGGFVPRGGFALDARGLRDFGLSRGEAVLRVLVLATVEYAVLAPATFALALYMICKGEATQAGLLPSWVLGVPIGAALVVGLLVYRRWRGGRPGWWPPLNRHLDAIQMTLNLLRSARSGPLTMVGMAIYWAGDIAALGICLAAFGAHVNGPALVVGYATGYALTRRSLPLAGAGAVEALLPFALVWASFPLASSVGAVLVYRLGNLWLMAIPAVIGLKRLRRARSPEGRRVRLRRAHPSEAHQALLPLAEPAQVRPARLGSKATQERTRSAGTN